MYKFSLFSKNKTVVLISMTERKREKMTNQISEKELSALNDLLTEEELLIKKFKMLAEHSTDQEVSAKFTEISEKHQGHFNSLYAQLK